MILDQRQTYFDTYGNRSYNVENLINSHSTLDKKALKELIETRWITNGRTLIEHVWYSSCWTRTDQEMFRHAFENGMYRSESSFMTLFDQCMDDYFEQIIVSPGDPFTGNKVLVALSGGIDSTYLLTKAITQCEDNKQVEAINIRTGEYDESQEAQETCDALGIRLHVQEYSPLEAARGAIKELGMPIDRGSTLPVYVMCNVAVDQEADLVVGDSADCVFAPSMNSHVRLVKEGGNIREAMMFDILQEIPYYYKYRFNQFGKGTRVILPYQHPAFLLGSLVSDMHTHLDPVKEPLRKLTSKIMTNDLGIDAVTAKKLCYRPKKALKVQGSSMQTIIDKEFDPIALEKVPEILTYFDRKERNEDLSQETKYTLALLNIWLEEVWRPFQ